MAPFFVVYQPEAGADLTLDLAGIPGQLWYQTIPHPRSGRVSAAKPVEGGAQQFFPAPGKGTWVLLVSRRNPPVGTASSAE